MTILSAPLPSARCPILFETIPSSSVARKPSGTEIAFSDASYVLWIRKGGHATRYAVLEFPVGGPGWDGRAFNLIKDDGSDYQVFLARNGHDCRCDCIGAERFGHCRHMDAMRHLLREGRLEDPRGGFPVEPWPSPEQVAAERKDLPF